MALYESIFIVRQDLSTQEVDKIAESFAKIVTDGKGSVVKKESWGLRTLAYKVNKNKRGHYVFLGIDANIDIINEMTRQFKLNEDVIRGLIIKVEEISKEPSPVLRGEVRKPRRVAAEGGKR